MNRSQASYQDKSEDYFKNVRREILPLLSNNVGRVFEIGCGAGDTLFFLRSTGRCEWAGGLELFSEAAASAREKNIDLVLDGNIEAIKLPFDENSMDVILCLDVLEHLNDPWSVIRRMHALLKPGGALICSIPNVRNYKVMLPLLFMGRWQYADWGILDRTHLRFFTKQSAMELASCSGLEIDMVKSTLYSKAAIANLITLSMFKPFLEYQYLIRAIKK